MNILASLVMICALAHGGLALKCWECRGGFECSTRDPVKAGQDGFTEEECTTDEVCYKEKTTMSAIGIETTTIIRKCMSGMKDKVGKCEDKNAGGLGGLAGAETTVCACNSDLCNSAPFSTHATILAVILPAILSIIVYRF